MFKNIVAVLLVVFAVVLFGAVCTSLVSLMGGNGTLLVTSITIALFTLPFIGAGVTLLDYLDGVR